jgi:uncharacterized coiled-coil protein SlyX
MANELEKRLAKLESSLAHIERLYEQLNEVVTEQSRELTRLKKQVAATGETLEGIEGERIRSTNAKPPHYQ